MAGEVEAPLLEVADEPSQGRGVWSVGGTQVVLSRVHNLVFDKSRASRSTFRRCRLTPCSLTLDVDT